MDKQEFLARLRKGLAGLPREEAEERLAFYSEMIDDRVEDGLSEEAAVAGIGSVDEIVAQIVAEIPLTRIVRERVKSKRRMKAWEIILLVLGSPIWLALMISAFAVLLSVYIVIWSVIVSLWAVFVSFAAGALGGAAAGILLVCRGDLWAGLVMISAGLALAGLAIVLFFACRALTRGALTLTKTIALWVKSLFVRKEKSG